ncbi:hypothetical protein RF11_04672 [Thelohanellus kitauei]|uniref:Uncharacterized protein n=1 Tax=Thelohanellus kitauei TaxID=669202 RepID=A0A0C2IZ94_THEKT|nr:hypothetical protein RF11_04672 [Thelohanellus kitauei]
MDETNDISTTAQTAVLARAITTTDLSVKIQLAKKAICSKLLNILERTTTYNGENCLVFAQMGLRLYIKGNTSGCLNHNFSGATGSDFWYIKFNFLKLSKGWDLSNTPYWERSNLKKVTKYSDVSKIWNNKKIVSRCADFPAAKSEFLVRQKIFKAMAFDVQFPKQDQEEEICEPIDKSI